MQNYKEISKISNPKKSCANFNTLAQLSTTEKKLTGRLKSKFITNSFIFQLIEQNSPLKKSYWNTYYCNNNIYVENGQVKTKYCKNRWCLTCARIKTATYINYYFPVIEKLKDKQYLTLTIPNVPEDKLLNAIENMQNTFSGISNDRKFRKRIYGIRKLEVTYNPKRNDYHPHYHLIISGVDVATEILQEWLKKYPSADIKGQDIQECDDNTLQDLFKYVTKIIQLDPKKKERRVYIKALDNILQALKRKRTFQTYGIKKLKLEDDFDVFLEDRAEEIEFFEWEQEVANWCNVTTGENLVNYSISNELKELSESIRNNK